MDRRAFIVAVEGSIAPAPLAAAVRPTQGESSMMRETARVNPVPRSVSPSKAALRTGTTRRVLIGPALIEASRPTYRRKRAEPPEKRAPWPDRFIAMSEPDRSFQ